MSDLVIPTPEALEERTDVILERLGQFFMGSSPVHKAAEQIARILTEEGIPFAVAGALSLGIHGFVRATEDVDILITREGLARFKASWLGRGYVELREGGRPVRDTVNNIKIDFLIAGDFPGDGKPKPVAFPDPGSAGMAAGKYRVLSLERLVEIKLASGLTAPHRLHDLADILRLIRSAGLPRDFATHLDPYVAEKYDELWLLAQHPEEEY